jgi:hypothetical protein
LGEENFKPGSDLTIQFYSLLLLLLVVVVVILLKE